MLSKFVTFVAALLLATSSFARYNGAQVEVRLLNNTPVSVAASSSTTLQYTSLESSTYQALAISVTSAGAVAVEIDVQVGYAHPVTRVVTYFDAENAQNIAVTGGAGTVKRAVGLVIPVTKEILITVRNNGASTATINALYVANY